MSIEASRFAKWAGNLADPEKPAKTSPPRTLVAFILWSMQGLWLVLAFACVGFMFGGATESLMMYALGRIIDATAMGPDGFWSQNLGLIIAAVFLVMVLRPLAFTTASIMQSIALAPNLHNQVLLRLNRYASGHSVTFFDNDFAGRLAQKKMQTASATTQVVTDAVNVIVFAFSSALGMVLLSGAVSAQLGATVVIWIVLYLLTLRYFLPRVRARSKTRANARAAVTGQIVDTVTNIKTVKLFARDDHEDRGTVDTAMSFRNAAITWAEMAVGMRGAMITIAGILPVAMIWQGLLLWQSGAASSGDLAAIGAMSIRLSQMTGFVSWTLMSIYGALGEIEDGLRSLTPPHELVDAKNATQLDVTRGGIEFRDVTFAYGSDVGGIKKVSLTIQPGEKLGIVGASGAGKSTLASLLLRLYDPEHGHVAIDGQNIALVTQNSLRQKIGMVTQETAMFNRSARDNIIYGRSDASDAEIENAVKRAKADDFIKDLRDQNGRIGMDAHLGERGVKLSGGQRQRIALARAMLKDAPILVLDEATSALDSEVEAAIQDALKNAMQGKTVVAIAHRLSTISSMDRIIVLDRGHIVEEGRHEDLLAANGLYTRYWNRQSGGFIATQDAAE